MTTGVLPRASAAEIEAAWNWVRAGWGRGAPPAVVAVIGFGSGAVLDALDQHAPKTRMLVLDPGAEGASPAASHPLFQSWREQGRLIYLAGPDYAGADQAWRIFPTKFEAPAFVIHPDAALGPLVAKAAEVLKKILVGAEANAKARQKFAPRYLINSLGNLSAIVTGPSVTRLKSAFAGVPAIVVGAGPSLDAAYDELRAARGRAVIIATDTALRPLLGQGIVPELVVGLDPSDTNARHFFSLPECADTWLVAESALDPRAAVVFGGRTLWCRASDHQPWPLLRKLGAEDGHLDVWGSVLTGAFQVAALAGCDPVVAVGADLSYSTGRPYARGTTYEFDWAWQASFGTTVEETWRAQMARRETIELPDVHGANTPTTAVLLAFRDWMLGQATRGERRIVNASGRGMLFGPGVEQMKLSDALAGHVRVPSIGSLAARRSDVRPSRVAREVRALADELRAGKIAASPFTEWAEFSGGSFDRAAVLGALEASASLLDTKRGRTATPFAIAWDLVADANPGDVVAKLPELSIRIRAALNGDEPPFVRGTSVVNRNQRGELIVRALELLRSIADEAARGDDFVSWPDPALAGRVPAAGIAMWPDTLRWGVSVFEALLAKVWDRADDSSEPLPFALGSVLPRDVSSTAGSAAAARPFASHACVLLAIEWLRTLTSLDEAGARELRPAIHRLFALERLMRTWPVPAPGGSRADLILQANGPRSATMAILPLGLAEASLARILTGAVRQHDGETWELARAHISGVSVRIGIRADAAKRGLTRNRAVVWSSVRARALSPEMLTHAGWPAAVVAGSVGAAALAVTPFSMSTHLIEADGEVTPYQTWPRPITGALSIGDQGDFAWSNVLNLKTGARPYVMFRRSADADVEIVDLPFRPSAGIWWKDRIFWNCLPTPGANGGVGSWTPGGDVRFELPELTLLPLVERGDALGLEPLVIDSDDAVSRRSGGLRWRWTPGSEPVAEPVGPHGPVSSIAKGREWTAYAHPHTDTITFVADDGRELAMRCYYPLRLAWAAGALIVCTGERELIRIAWYSSDALDMLEYDEA